MCNRRHCFDSITTFPSFLRFLFVLTTTCLTATTLSETFSYPPFYRRRHQPKSAQTALLGSGGAAWVPE